MTPAHDVAAYLIANLHGLTAGGNVVVGDEMIPPRTGQTALLASIVNLSSRPQEYFLQGGSVDRPHAGFADVRINVRGDKEDRRAAENLAADIVRALSSPRPPIDGYFDVRVLTGAALNLGRDEDGFPLFSINVQMKTCGQFLPLFWGRAAPGSVTTEAAILALTGTAGKPYPTRALRNATRLTVDAGAGDFFYCCPVDFVRSAPAPSPTFWDTASTRTQLLGSLLATGISVTLDNDQVHSYAVFTIPSASVTSSITLM